MANIENSTSGINGLRSGWAEILLLAERLTAKPSADDVVVGFLQQRGERPVRDAQCVQMADRSGAPIASRIELA